MTEPETLESKRRARLFDLIRQQDHALSPTRAGTEDEDGFPPGFVRAFQDSAARSLGQRPADRLLMQSLRGRR